MILSKSIKILAVDDEVQNTKILTEIISFYPKYSIKTAHNAEEALKLLEYFKPDILLLDIMMPGVNGYELCTKIRSLPNIQYLKIIMLSGLSLVGDRLKAYEAGADDYISKPFVEEELLAKIDVFSKLGRMEEIDSFKTTAMNLLVHETRTPLNGIYLSIDLLSKEISGNKSAGKYVDILRNSSERLKYLIEKISRYCVVKTGVVIDVRVGELCGFFKTLLRDINVNDGKLNYILDCENVMLYTDWNLLAEAVKEILINITDRQVSDTAFSNVQVKAYLSAENLIILIGSYSKIVTENDKNMMRDVLYAPDILHYTSGMALNIAIAGTIINCLDGNLDCRDARNGSVEFKINIPAKRSNS